MKHMVENRTVAARTKYNLRKFIRDLQFESDQAREILLPKIQQIIREIDSYVYESEEEKKECES